MNKDLLNRDSQVLKASRRNLPAKSGKLKGKRSIHARVTLTIDGLGLKHEIGDDIAFE